jgi:hypothetical protein
MRLDDFQHKLLLQACTCALVISSVALADNSGAASVVGTANATVVESASVTLSGTVFNLGSFTNSQSTSGPLLRAVSPPPSVSGVTGAEGGTNSQGGTAAQTGGTGAVAVQSAANSATVNVTRKADGSLGVSGGSNLTIAVSQSVAGSVNTINIEYN